MESKIIFKSPIEDKIVLMGMSCVGKTTFANQLQSMGYQYQSFDAKFRYSMRLHGISRKKQWENILNACKDKFVLDNWTTEDLNGEVLYSCHSEICLFVLYDTRERILSRYRVPVKGLDAHKMMYEKMYIHTPFESYKKVRFLHVMDLKYEEHSIDEFREYIHSVKDQNISLKFNKERWVWGNEKKL